MNKIIHILIIFMVGIFFSCQNDMAVVNDITGDDKEATQVVINAEYVFSEGGKLQNKLTAGKMRQFMKDTSYILLEDNIKLEIYDTQEQKVAQLTSKRGAYFQNSARMIAMDSVVFTNTSGEKLLTDRLVWLQDSAIIYSLSPVTIYRNGGVIYGDGLVSNESFEKYTITKPRGQMEVKPPKEQ